MTGDAAHAVTGDSAHAMTGPDLLARRAAVIMGTYAAPSLTLVRGEGCRVWDDTGRSYLDLVGGIAVSSLGHAHPAVIEAVTAQIGALAHTSNLYGNLPSLELAERLVALLDVGETDAKVFFCNSGTEANEAALKIARRTGRPQIIATERAFHGRTLGALSITGQVAKRTPFEPLLPGVQFISYGDVDALREAVGEQTAAVFLEPVLGEAGVILPPDGYLAAAREICTAAGALLVVDEVQSGIGRTGAWYASRAQGVLPDVITLAKGLAGGLPIGACIGIGAAASLLQPGDHGSTFGGNPVACAGALAVLETLERDGVLDSVSKVGEHAVRRLARRSLAAAGRCPWTGPLAGFDAHQSGVRCHRGRRTGSGFPGQSGGAGCRPARASAGVVGGGSGPIRCRTARHPRRGGRG